MRVLYLSKSILPSPHANSVHVVKMAQAFATLGHDVLLSGFSNPNDKRPISQVYGIDFLPKVSLFDAKSTGALGKFGLACSVMRLAKSYNPDLIYSRSLGALLFIKSKFPYAYESHWKPKTILHRTLERSLISRDKCVGFVTISAALRDIYLNELSFPKPRKFIVAHDGADLPPTTNTLSPNRRPRIGYVGSLYSERGIDLILRTACLLPSCDFHIIGGLPHQVDDLKSKTHGIMNLHIHGHKDHAEIGPLMETFDVVLAPYQRGLPSLEWASPLKIFEYMSFGKAVICSDFPVFREILQNEFSALLVKSDDVDAWMKSILRLTEDKALRTRIAANAFNEFTKNYQWKNRAKFILDSLEMHSSVRSKAL